MLPNLAAYDRGGSMMETFTVNVILCEGESRVKVRLGVLTHRMKLSNRWGSFGRFSCPLNALNMYTDLN